MVSPIYFVDLYRTDNSSMYFLENSDNRCLLKPNSYINLKPEYNIKRGCNNTIKVAIFAGEHFVDPSTLCGKMRNLINVARKFLLL